MLGIIALSASLLALYWVFLVPIFQAPDEDVHFDYVLGIYSAKGLLRARDKPVAVITQVSPYIPKTHPSTWYLMVRTNALGIRGRPEVKAPLGYGSTAYFRALNQGAPQSPQQPFRHPFVLTLYPFGYYAAVALWLALLSALNGGVVTLFFGARLFSVLLLPLGLLASYGMVRELGLKRGQALLLTAAIGFFPLTSFVCSSVQPDSLSFALVSLSIWGGLVARRRLREENRFGILWLVGVTFSLLLVTKYHFFLCVFPPIAALLLAEHWALPARKRRWGELAVALSLPSLLFGFVQVWIGAGAQTDIALRNLYGNSYDPAVREALYKAAGGPLPYVITGLLSALKNFFVGGLTFQTFWGRFGWAETPLIIGSAGTDAVVKFSIAASTLFVLAISLLRCGQVLTRLMFIACVGRPGKAARLALANPLMNAYVLFVVMMVFLYVLTNNSFLAQGRNWFPFLPAIFWLGVSYAPKAVNHRSFRTLFARGVLACLVLYSVVGSYYSIGALKRRFYGESQIERLAFRTARPVAAPYSGRSLTSRLWARGASAASSETNCEYQFGEKRPGAASGEPGRPILETDRRETGWHFDGPDDRPSSCSR